MQRERTMPAYAIRSGEPDFSDEEEMLEARALVLRENRVDGRNEWEPMDERCRARGQGIPF